MRKNTIRKIVHGMLDLLPLFVIPIFAIYARNENAQFGYEVTQEVNKAVDFNQNILNGNFENTDNWTSSFGTSMSVNNNVMKLNIDTPTIYDKAIYQYRDFTLNHQYLIKAHIRPTFTNDGRLDVYCINLGGFIYQNSTLTSGTDYYIQFKSNCIQNGNNRLFFGVVGSQSAFNNATDYIEYRFINLYDLTEMFGEGNEPTIEEFNNYFPNAYYPYTESQEVVIENYETITYNDTDIGSQMIYTLYNTVDKYFNMNNVFGMHDLYNWFEINIFHQTSPLGIYIVWNIVLYEFVMDLLMLLYALFMFFIDMCKKLIEAPVNAIK